ncbi:group III truncated hemoglobin [Maribacter algarum]|uniref:Group III truncated hemoglobin n=1 Tax=Maribacter algarum (ex Zhang et al. 2020) TaxID=2578118 RepID=A0A5S3PS36_9FLAO|nr:group III truncated hemoglobin [Maribacter algarum]TMM57522.1 group III truncated hemoglobin [Maribacter algarum]
MKKEITDREDVFDLVETFYTKVRSNELLGPIFENHIDDWPKHLDRLTDFWETNLFFIRKFKGNPLLKHQIVDAGAGYSIDEHHFGVWLNLWFETVDQLFKGEKAATAKNRARSMGTFFHINLFKARPENS